jgi:hypothetical protein
MAIGSMLVAVLLIVAQALGIGGQLPGVGATVPPAGAAAQQSHDFVKAAMEQARFQVQDPLTAYRPGEPAQLIGIPRRLVQAVLPSDPTGGYVVIYEFAGANEADAAGRDFLAYLHGGVGAIQYPADEQYVLRRIGTTLVFFAWSPTVSPDPEVARMAATLETVGNPLTGGQ